MRPDSLPKSNPNPALRRLAPKAGLTYNALIGLTSGGEVQMVGTLNLWIEGIWENRRHSHHPKVRIYMASSLLAHALATCEKFLASILLR